MQATDTDASTGNGGCYHGRWQSAASQWRRCYQGRRQGSASQRRRFYHGQRQVLRANGDDATTGNDMCYEPMENVLPAALVGASCQVGRSCHRLRGTGVLPVASCGPATGNGECCEPAAMMIPPAMMMMLPTKDDGAGAMALVPDTSPTYL
jgi:hypothetical protein